MGGFGTEHRTILIIVPNQEDAENLVTDINFFLGENKALFYPPWEILPFEKQLPHPDIVSARLETLYKLSQGSRPIIVSTPSAILQKVMARDVLLSYVQRLEIGKEAKRDALLEQLISMGYKRMSMVEEKGEIRVSGAIIDIFPPNFAHPLRMEFFGDEIESIRTFDIATQKSMESLKEALLLPMKENSSELGPPREAFGGVVRSSESKTKIFDTFFRYISEDYLLFLDNPDAVHEAAAAFEKEVLERKERLEEEGDSVVPHKFYLSAEEMHSIFDSKGWVAVSSGIAPSKIGFTGISEFSTESNLDIRQDIATRKEELLKSLSERIKSWQDLGWNIFLVCHTKGQAERLKDLLEGYSLACGMWDVAIGMSLSHPLPAASHVPTLVIGDLNSGFRFPSLKYAFITEEEIFGQRIKRRPPPSKKVDLFLTQLQDLNVGDFIVHSTHGIGMYQGLKRLKIEEIENDFLLLEYQGRDKLYLPVQRLNLVGKYQGVEGKAPTLDKLGTTVWEKKKHKVKKAVEEMAKELLHLYAERKVVEGFSFGKPDRMFQEFEASFEYDETPDQMGAIEDVLKDMEDPKPMDRLICGDVGYGKTEVAMRAAFKAVEDNKQVAVLVPTTVLAQQHYLTFKNRFSPYPVVVDMLSRFRSQKEQKETLKKLDKGEIDVIIGTHRLLQKDVAFKELGLIVVDEEHRFGVSHKERLKQMKKQVDVLTLTATPIPRTLHMSLAGIRDLSIINTPPEDRLAIKTIVARFDDELIRDAVRRELDRGGQVFFVHNRVESIQNMAGHLKRVVPEARIAVAHGQMKEKELEKIMAAFMSKEYNVLLSTSIIESGLDIPSANTILINRADMFGLAEIYQLRGRVGRSSHRAYAYLLTPPDLVLSGDAKKRLKVLQELSDLGAGFRLAAYDLEIRGAGELLGSAQSGGIAEVGFEMYTQLLEEAIRELKGETVEEEIDPEINLRVTAIIPETYIPDERQRLNIYKRIASVRYEDDITNLKDEIRDRFGDIPELVENLFKTVGLKLLLKRVKAKELSQKGSWLYLTFLPNTPVEPEQVLSIVKKNPRTFRLLPDSKFAVYLEKGKDLWDEIRYVLKQLVKGCYYS